MTMTRKTTQMSIAAALAALFLYAQNSFAWGFWAHQFITRKAVAVMPPESRNFFVQYVDSLSKHSIDPDLWRRYDKQESNRHYIDIDMLDSFPFAKVPASFDSAVAVFGEETVQKAGIVPWRIQEMLDSLTTAMRHRNKRLILRYASALAHYVEDIHMPLHTVTNYDGQLTGNKGIHSRYERWMVEAHKAELERRVGPATPELLADPLISTFDWIRASYVWTDNLLLADNMAKLPGKKYAKREDYDAAYYARLFTLTDPFTTTQMSKAATAVASFWLTAWHRAGKPALP